MSKTTTGRQMLEALEKRVAELERDHQELKRQFYQKAEIQQKQRPVVENA